MELTNNHREALLNELEKAQADKELQTTCLNRKDTDGRLIIEYEEDGHIKTVILPNQPLIIKPTT